MKNGSFLKFKHLEQGEKRGHVAPKDTPQKKRAIGSSISRASFYFALKININFKNQVLSFGRISVFGYKIRKPKEVFCCKLQCANAFGVRIHVFALAGAKNGKIV